VQLAKQKLVAKGKEVLLQLKAKDLANAEAENAAAAYSSCSIRD
jgi:hypothetical protein